MSILHKSVVDKEKEEFAKYFSVTCDVRKLQLHQVKRKVALLVASCLVAVGAAGA